MTGTTYNKSMVEISQNFVVFSEYMNLKRKCKYPLRAKLTITEKIKLKIWGSELLKKTYLKFFAKYVIFSAIFWSNCFEEKMTPGTYVSFKICSIIFSTKRLDQILMASYVSMQVLPEKNQFRYLVP